jgi:integrase
LIYNFKISGEKLDACIKWYKTNGLAPRYKKSGGRRKDPRFLSHDDIKRVVSFIENYAEDHAIILPGRIPGFKNFRMKLNSTFKCDKVFCLPPLSYSNGAYW